MLKLHLGCGHMLLSGWRNIDGWPIPGAECWDLKQGLPRDIAPNSVDFIHTEHFLEHIDRDSAIHLLKDCHRALKKGGVMRIIVPDLKHLVHKYLTKDLDWGGPGGWEPKSPARMLNEGMRSWGHEFLYDIDELFATCCTEAGFTGFLSEGVGLSRHAALRGIDFRKDEHDLRVELTK